MSCFLFRFDLLQGFNGQEMQSSSSYYIQFYYLIYQFNPAEDALNNGLSLDSIKGILETKECAMPVPLSTKLCVEFLVDLYQLDQFTDNRQRTIAFSYLLGATFNLIQIILLLSLI